MQSIGPGCTAGAELISTYDPPVPDAAHEWITVSQAARLLGLRPHTVYGLIDRGELRAEVTVPTDRPKRRRQVRLQPWAVDEYLDRARLKPGECSHLFPGDGR